MTLLPAELLRQVRRIEFRTRRLVDSRFTGDYRSLFKGQGMEFAEVREYQPGDEVRSIDWNVSARMGRPFVKRYVEERELTVLLALDVSGSQGFGTEAAAKHDRLVELSAVLALAAVRNNDRVGLVAFSDRVEHAVAPRKGRKQALRLIRDLVAIRPASRRTDFAVLLERVERLLPHRAVVFVGSDFAGEGIERALGRLARRHDVVAVTVDDPREETLPDVGLARFADPETGEELEVDTGDPAVRAAFAERVAAERDARTALFARLGLDEIGLRTDADVAEPLLHFVRARARRATGAVRARARAGVQGVRGLVTASALMLAALAGVPGAAAETLLPPFIGAPVAHVAGSPRVAASQPAADGQPLGPAGPRGPTALDGRVEARVVVEPDTVTVGDHLRVRIRLTVPPEAEVRWPPMPDTGAVVAPAGAFTARSEGTPGGTVWLAEYPLAAWDTGRVASGLGDVRVVRGGDTLVVPLGATTIAVRSVLPADSASRRPKPPRPAFGREVPWWERWWPVLLLPLALLAWWWWRRRRAAAPAAASARAARDAYDDAQDAFDRLDALDLVAAGEPARTVLLATGVLRTYLAARNPRAHRATTSAELLASVGDDARVPLPRLVGVLEWVDAVRYARATVGAGDARAIVAELRAIVETVETVERARRAVLRPGERDDDPRRLDDGGIPAHAAGAGGAGGAGDPGAPTREPIA